MDRIETTIAFFEAHPEIVFDTAFLKSVQQRLKLGKELTMAQNKAVDNIFHGYKIAHWTRPAEGSDRSGRMLEFATVLNTKATQTDPSDRTE